VNSGATRRFLRLAGYDYSLAGAYFVTICTAHRVCSLGSIDIDFFRPSLAGEMVAETWNSLPERFPFVALDAFVVMPNHLHGILLLTDPEPHDRETSPRQLGNIIRAFKAASTRQIRETGTVNFAWQRDYFDHIIRTEQDLERIRAYIEANPSRWHEDLENPSAVPLPRPDAEPWER
jgi:REP element-mobilizing transposase RayT